jgi:F-type H+-transporting ATPase subunit delta
MKLSRAASRYAKAVLGIAQDKGQADAVNADMRDILSTVSKSKDLRSFLTSPLLKADQKKSGLKEVFKSSNAITQGLFDLLASKNRTAILEDVAMSYVVMYEDLNKREIATVTTAVELSAVLEEKILAKAKTLAGKDITLVKKVDPSILGGYILRVGDREINASVERSFSELRRTFAV